jgi:hypothetical protein
MRISSLCAMKVIIMGMRDFHDYAAVVEAIAASGFKITEVVSGCAPGVDALGERWAAENRLPVKQFPANWLKHRKAAGPIRNAQMAKYADALIAIWDGKSRGTGNMIKQAKEHFLRVHVFRVNITDI